MKKNLIIAGIVTGIILVTQFNSSLTASKDINFSEQEDLKKIRQDLQNEENQLKENFKTLREKEGEKIKILAKNVQDDLKEAEIAAGFQEATGAGLVIRIFNEKNNNQDLLIRSLKTLINLLFSMNAEAVSINGYRIVFKTPIISLANNVLIGSFHISAPFEIQVIGNTEFIFSALKTKEILEPLRKKIKNKEINLEIQKINNLKIPAYLY